MLANAIGRRIGTISGCGYDSDEDEMYQDRSELYDPSYTLCALDIYSIIGYRVGLILESELNHMEVDDRTIKNLIRNGALLILWGESARSVGHWGCITLNGDNLVYFDSFGREPPHKVLAGIINLYMNKKLQHDSASTCGRWVAHFIRYYAIDEDAYVSLFSKCRDKDGYITAATGNLASFNRRSAGDSSAHLGLWSWETLDR